MNVILRLTRNGRTFRADLTPFLFGTRAENEWDESKHPRQKDGKFSETGGNKNMKEISKEKIDSVRIDFSKDNYLPELGDDVCEEYGFEKNKIRLKKSIIERNKREHPDIKEEEAEKILERALYSPEIVIPAKGEGYFHFIAKQEGNESPLVMLDLKKSIDGFLDVVHFFKVRRRSRKKLEKK